MFLQKARLTSYALRVMGRDLLEEVYIDAPQIVETYFGEVVKIDRKRNGKEENTPGTRVLPESANMSGGKVSSRDQFGPVRGRRRPLGKPYAPVVPPRPTVEIKPKTKRQVPSSDEGESDTEDEDPATSQTLEPPSSESSVVVPKKKKKANKGRIESEGDGGSAQTAQAQPSTRTQPSTRVQQSLRVQPSVQAPPSVRAQPSASAGPSTAQTIPRAPRRIELEALGPADNSHIKKEVPCDEEVPSREVSGFRVMVPSESEDQTRRGHGTLNRRDPTFSMRIFRRTIQIGRSPSCLGIQ